MCCSVLQGRSVHVFFTAIWNCNHWSICVWHIIDVCMCMCVYCINYSLWCYGVMLCMCSDLPSLVPYRPAPMAVCRQCPTYRGGLSSLCSGASVAYTCPTPASHVMCRCCLQFMPLRPSSSDDDVPPQKCALCEKYYCNAYWQTGCSGMACRGGCLLPLKGL